MKNDEIKIGDEIKHIIEDDKGIVVNIDIFNRWHVTTTDVVLCLDDTEKSYWRKTGRHFPQIAEALEQMKNDTIKEHRGIDSDNTPDEEIEEDPIENLKRMTLVDTPGGEVWL